MSRDSSCRIWTNDLDVLATIFFAQERYLHICSINIRLKPVQFEAGFVSKPLAMSEAAVQSKLKIA